MSGEEDWSEAEVAAVEQMVAATKAMCEMITDMTARLVDLHRQGQALMHRHMLRHPDIAYLDAQLDGYYS